ncbi:hypothetical protein GGR34_000749 [Microvirga flocculans]|uniref:Holin of 3TMs, for gene-transfer release n=1 Tax=Microvirga flocculans TaxID=217168 RepID=A0A7W6ICY8_9HYPH|nr:3TM-type holin [Microvirga flocculans]MBB4039114.1 hypothetical protein [Microvirga flocculans]
MVTETIVKFVLKEVKDLILPELTKAVEANPPATPEEAKALAEAKLAQALSQMDLSKLDLQSSSSFRANWRSFIGWIAGASLAYELLVRPITTFILVNWFEGASVLPPAPAEFWRVLIGIVGLG